MASSYGAPVGAQLFSDHAQPSRFIGIHLSNTLPNLEKLLFVPSVNLGRVGDQDLLMEQLSVPSVNLGRAEAQDLRMEQPSGSSVNRERADECYVCLEPRTDTELFPCGHSYFCAQCVEAFMSEENPKCPSCHKSIAYYVNYY